MRRVAVLALLLAAAPALADLERVRVADLTGACDTGRPRLVLVVDGASQSDCSTGGANAEVPCWCDGAGAWSAVPALLLSPSDLDAADSPSDEECATYESTGTRVEWQACPSGGVMLDIGDDGGNDSLALAEIATANDDYSVCAEPSADKLLCDVGKIPPYRQHEIAHAPSSCAACEEFYGDAEALTWRWGNQGTSTLTYGAGAVRLDPQAVNNTNMRARWTTGPDGSTTDWTVTMKFGYLTIELLKGVGIAVLATGTEASPTRIEYCAFACYGGGAVLCRGVIGHGYYNSYTSYGAEYANYVRVSKSITGPYYLRLRYDTETKDMVCGFSTDGLGWLETAANTLSAHPTTSFAYYADPATNSTPLKMIVDWFRVRSDATGTTDPYPAGE